jgi:hypothetical protein
MFFFFEKSRPKCSPTNTLSQLKHSRKKVPREKSSPEIFALTSLVLRPHCPMQTKFGPIWSPYFQTRLVRVREIGGAARQKYRLGGARVPARTCVHASFCVAGTKKTGEKMPKKNSAFFANISHRVWRK